MIYCNTGLSDRVSLGLWITGLGTQYPPHILDSESLDAFAKRFYDVRSSGIKRLLRINRTTGIETRSAIRDYKTGYGTENMPPSIADMDVLFRTAGIDLTGNPGFDFLVDEKLSLSTSVDRTLLHGVGCAGGLAIMRTAAQLACAATMRDPSQISIASTLFSDAAAAFVLCNDLGLRDGIKPVFELLDWDSAVISGTTSDLEFRAEADGYRTVLNRTVPKYTVAAVAPMFRSLLTSIRVITNCDNLDIEDFDWALHPGGQAIIDGVQKAMRLIDEQLRATREIYKTRGNSSSPTSQLRSGLDCL
ncbi:unnamed protein product [Aureobasidium vineae]|uniref:Chalcone/stilbene synthase C-terminal domain-containing protein n=1 Tax=Aureobasidium vineae TaxID=2773715 RepID=A0A9N8P5P6_9PEZI|nr:unnamed protein product [Aureobasidium vineae]